MRAPTENVHAVAKAKGLDVTEVTVVVLERDRHNELIGELRQSGARVNLIRDGDVAPSIAAAQAFVGVDMLMGIGGTPEGVISAAAIKCLRGAIQGKLWPRNDEERQQLIDSGYDSTACSRPTTWSRAKTSSSPPPVSRAASSSAASASAARASRPSRS